MLSNVAKKDIHEFSKQVIWELENIYKTSNLNIEKQHFINSAAPSGYFQKEAQETYLATEHKQTGRIEGHNIFISIGCLSLRDLALKDNKKLEILNKLALKLGFGNSITPDLWPIYNDSMSDEYWESRIASHPNMPIRARYIRQRSESNPMHLIWFDYREGFEYQLELDL